MRMIKYFIYARKSSEGDDRQITSINDQVEECLKIAKRQNLHVVDIISESKSAKNPGRKKFNEMIARIDKGEADGVITWKLNRIARNPVDGGNFIWQLQKNKIKHVQTIGQSFYPKDNLVTMYIEFGMSSQYSADLSVSTARGTAKKAGRGWFPCPTLPVGYLHNTKKEIAKGAPEIIKDETQFNVVKSLLKKVINEHTGVTELKKLADAQGLKSIRGNLLALSSFYRLLRNEFYCGYFHWKNDEGEKVRILGKHIPMLTPAEFDTLQNILKRGVVTISKETIPSEYTSIFNCGECGCKFTPSIVNRAYCTICKCKFSIKNKKECPKCATSITNKEQFTFLYKEYYRCSKKRTKCSQPYLSKDRLDIQVIDYIQTLSIDTDLYKWCISYLEKRKEKNPSKIKEQHLKQRISEWENKLQGYTNMRAEQELTKQEYQNYSEPVKREVEILQLELVNLEYQITNWKKELERGLNLAQNLVEIFENGDHITKRNVLIQIGKNPSILNKKAHFITPKHLGAVKELVDSKRSKTKWEEPKKSLVEQGDLCGISLPFYSSAGNARLVEPTKKQY